MTGNGFLARVLVWMRPVWTLLARPFRGSEAPSPEVQALKRELDDTKQDDVRLADMEQRKTKLLRDNHLVSDVERALGLRS